MNLSNKNKYEHPLVERYASKEMSFVWSPAKKFSTWRVSLDRPASTPAQPTIKLLSLCLSAWLPGWLRAAAVASPGGVREGARTRHHGGAGEAKFVPRYPTLTHDLSILCFPYRPHRPPS